MVGSEAAALAQEVEQLCDWLCRPAATVARDSQTLLAIMLRSEGWSAERDNTTPLGAGEDDDSDGLRLATQLCH